MPASSSSTRTGCQQSRRLRPRSPAPCAAVCSAELADAARLAELEAITDAATARLDRDDGSRSGATLQPVHPERSATESARHRDRGGRRCRRCRAGGAIDGRGRRGARNTRPATAARAERARPGPRPCGEPAISGRGGLSVAMTVEAARRRVPRPGDRENLPPMVRSVVMNWLAGVVVVTFVVETFRSVLAPDASAGVSK